jgi:uncharacterized protein
MATIAASMADNAIGVYQRYISPYKGFCCAYRAHTGKRSCSAYGRAVVQKLGLLALLAALPKQFERCQVAYRNMAASAVGASLALRSREKNASKADNCVDLPCDLPCSMPSDALPVDLPCDLPCDCSF